MGGGEREGRRGRGRERLHKAIYDEVRNIEVHQLVHKTSNNNHCLALLKVPCSNIRTYVHISPDSVRNKNPVTNIIYSRGNRDKLLPGKMK